MKAVARRLFAPYSVRLLALALLSALGAAMEALGLILLSVLLSILIGAAPGGGHLAEVRHAFAESPRAFLAILGVIYVARAALALFAAWASFQLANHIVDDWRVRMLRGLLGASPRAAENRQGAMVQLLVEEPAVGAQGLGAAGVFIQNAVSTVAIYAVILWLSPIVALALTATAALAGGSLVLLSRWSRRIAAQRSTAFNDGYGVITEIVSALKQYQTFGLEREGEVRAASAFSRMRRMQVWSSVVTSSPRLFVEVTFIVGLISILLLIMPTGGRDVILASSGLAVAAALRLLPSFSASAGTWVQIQQAWPALTKIDAQISAGESGPCGGSVLAKKPARAIMVEAVHYTRDGRGEILRGVTMTLDAGRMTAIAGTSGAGKSTLVDLLIALETPSEGRITVDGIDLRQIDARSWRSRLGVVLQDGFLLAGTVRQNLSALNPGASPRLVDEVLEVVGARTLVDELPDGLETRVGERGVTLSGGQRQRLSIARALIREPDVLILDEATSALDPSSDLDLQTRIRSFRPGMTIIAIAHRLSSIRHADRIYVVADGVVKESGSHDGLLAAGGLYATMGRSLNSEATK